MKQGVVSDGFCPGDLGGTDNSVHSVTCSDYPALKCALWYGELWKTEGCELPAAKGLTIRRQGGMKDITLKARRKKLFPVGVQHTAGKQTLALRCGRPSAHWDPGSLVSYEADQSFECCFSTDFKNKGTKNPMSETPSTELFVSWGWGGLVLCSV